VSPVVASISDLSEDEIIQIDPGNFTKKEWESLSEELQNENLQYQVGKNDWKRKDFFIYFADDREEDGTDLWEYADDDTASMVYGPYTEDTDRAKALAKFLSDHLRWHVLDPDQYSDQGRDDFHHWLSYEAARYPGELWASLSSSSKAEWDSLEEEFRRRDEDVVQQTIRDIVLNESNWLVEMGGYSRATHDFEQQISARIYFTIHDLVMSTGYDADQFFYSDLEVALPEVESGDDYYDIDELWDSFVKAIRGAKYAAYEVAIHESDIYVRADIDWDSVKDDVRDALGEEIDFSQEIYTPVEDRIFMRFPDKFYVVDLLAQELDKEGEVQNMCVGDPEHGYIQGVLNGDIKILSLRRPGGKPLLTFEVQLYDDEPLKVAQISGKSNRLPGWDLNSFELGKLKEGAKVKKAEVERAIAVVKKLGLDPEEVPHLRPGLAAIYGPEKQFFKGVEFKGWRNNPNAHVIRVDFDQLKTFDDPVGPL